MGQTDTGEPIEREVYLEEVVGTYRREGKEGIRERYGERVAEEVKVEEREGKVTVSYPVFRPEQREAAPQPGQPKDYVRKPRELDYDRAGGFGVGEEEYLSPEQVKKIQREQFKGKLMQENMYYYVDEEGNYVYPHLEKTLREQTRSEKVINRLRGGYQEAVGKYYAEKSVEAAKLGAQIAGAYAGGAVVGSVFGTLASIGPKARIISQGAGGLLTGVSVYTGIKESSRAIKEGRPGDAIKISTMFMVAGAGAGKGWRRGEMFTSRFREYGAAKAELKKYSISYREYPNPLLEKQARPEYVLESVMPRRAAQSMGRFIREERGELLLKLEKKPLKSRTDVVDLTNIRYDREYNFFYDVSQVGKSGRIRSYPETGIGRTGWERLSQRVREVTKPRRAPVQGRKRGSKGEYLNPFFPIAALKRKQREGILTLSKQAGENLMRMIMGERGAQIHKQREERLTLNLNVPALSQERVGLHLQIPTRTPGVGKKIKQKVKRRRTRPRARLPGFRKKNKQQDLIKLNIDARYAEELIYPFFGFRIRGRRRRRW